MTLPFVPPFIPSPDYVAYFKRHGEDIFLIHPRTLEYWIVEQHKAPWEVFGICVNHTKPRVVPES